VTGAEMAAREDQVVCEIRRAVDDEWRIVRRLRLAALRDSPDWFWATYDEEVGRPDEWWRERVDSGAWFIAYTDGLPVGLAGAITAPELDPSARQLVSMWVDPAARSKGVGRQLIEAVEKWARAQDVRALQLQVTEGNAAAYRLYRRCGFAPTGRTEPGPRDPSLVEHEMRLPL
jgi:GNAT superfamily N-acetyltransferase